MYGSPTNTLARNAPGSNASTNSGPALAEQATTAAPGGASGPTASTQTNPVGSAPSNITSGPPVSTAPAPIQAFGGIAQVAPTYQTATGYNASLVDPNQSTQAYNQFSSLLNQSLQPTFALQDQSLQDDLAARGISNTGAASYDLGNLQAQQAATIAGSDTGFVSQMFGDEQADVAANQAALNSAGVFNASAQNTASGANAAAANAATGANASAYNSDVLANYNAYNAYQNELLGLGAQDQGALQSAYLNSFGPQSGVTSAYGTSIGDAGSAANNAFAGSQAATASEFGTLGTFGGNYLSYLGQGGNGAFNENNPVTGIAPGDQ
jgi:hypothetical protein